MKTKRLILLFLLMAGSIYFANALTVTNIQASYHDGQIFIIWENITTADTGFYYLYSNTVPIDSNNIQTSTYLGRVMYNFGYDYRLTHSDRLGISRYLIVNDNPLTFLTPTQNMFVMNCTADNQPLYFAVRSNYGKSSPNWTVKAGANATTTSTVQHLDPIKVYHYESVLYNDKTNEMLDVYVHYGSNVAVGSYPDMTNEGCLVFHFGIIKTGPVGGMNVCYVKFHGGNGNFITDALSTNIENSWKISFDDWIPAFSINIDGDNTRWLGYCDKVDIYKVTDKSAPPLTGTIRGYTFHRLQWEFNWIMQTYPNTIDPNHCYLMGESQGCSGVLLNAVLSPQSFAAGNMTDGKYNLDAPEDDNPNCKYNDGNSGRKSVNVYWGDHNVTNLPTDIPKKTGGNNYWNIYDLTNMNNVFSYYKNTALPWLEGISGKKDGNTCWEEKVDFYAAVDKTQEGGQYFYDMRGHDGGPSNEWQPLGIKSLERFANNISFPAFSNASIDGDPGTDSNNPVPPYSSGDSVGTVHGNIDWVDSTIYDTNTAWQVQLFIHPDTLEDSTFIPRTMPKYSSTDVTIRRPSHFINIPQNTVLCWTNTHKGKVIQQGNITQNYKGNMPKPLTAKKVKIYPDGSILRVEYCNLPSSQKSSSNIASNDNHQTDIVYPNPFKNNFTLSFMLEEKSDVMVELYNPLGEKLEQQLIKNSETGQQQVEINTSGLIPGVYFLKVKTNSGENSYKVVKE